MKRFRGFLSYSRKDKKHASRVHRELEKYRLPRNLPSDTELPDNRKIGRIFRDEDELSAAPDLGAMLEGAISESENLIVICSPNAVESRWVNEEILHFKRTGRESQVFAVIVDGIPNASSSDDPDQQKQECFPPALKYKIDPDGQLSDRPTEPLGVDIRVEKFDKLLARLVAGLINVPFDSLWRRERRRARSRQALVMSILSIVSLGLVWQSVNSESSRLQSIREIAEQLDNEDDFETRRLLTIASEPPVSSVVGLFDEMSTERLNAIAYNGLPNTYFGYGAHLSSEFRESIQFVNEDRTAAFSWSTGSAASFGLAVWDLEAQRLVSRIPIESENWSHLRDFETDMFSRNNSRLTHINVSQDGRTILAAYDIHPDTTSRIVAVWRLNGEFACSNLCLPELIEFEAVANASLGTGSGPKLSLSDERDEAIYVEGGFVPVLIDFGPGDLSAVSMTTDAACEVDMPLAGVYAETGSEYEEGNYWLSDGAKGVAYFTTDGRTLHFVSPMDDYFSIDVRFTDAFFEQGHEEALEDVSEDENNWPAPTNFDETNSYLRPQIHVEFIPATDRALIVTDSNWADRENALHILAEVDLGECTIAAWPNQEVLDIPHELRSEQTETWSFHRYERFMTSLDGRFFGVQFSESRDYRNYVRVWDLESQQPIGLFAEDDPAWQIYFPVRTQKAFEVPLTDYSYDPKQVILIDSETGEQKTPTVYYAGNANRVLTPNRDRVAHVQRAMITIQTVSETGFGEVVATWQADEALPNAQFSPNGQWFVSYGGEFSEKIVVVRNLESGEQFKRSFDTYGKPVLGIQNDGTVLIDLSTVNDGDTIVAQNFVTGSSQTLLEYQSEYSMRSFQAGSSIYLYSAEGLLWRIGEDLVPADLRDEISLPNSFTPYFGADTNPTIGIVAGYDEAPTWVDLETGEALTRLEEAPFLSAYSFSESGRYFASASGDAIQLWRVGEAQALVTYNLEEVDLTWFGPNDEFLFAVDKQGRMHRIVINSSYQSAFNEACQRLRDESARLSLTDQEMELSESLRAADRTPCERDGLLSADYYKRLLINVVPNLDGRGIQSNQTINSPGLN